LSLQAECRADDAHGSQFQIGIARNDHRILAAEFKDHRAGILTLGIILIHLHADIEGTGKGDAIHFGAVDQSLTKSRAGSGHKVNHTFRNARIAEAIHQEAHDPGSICSGFDHKRIARNQGAPEGPPVSACGKLNGETTSHTP
jgi:hypothetical protein